MRFIVRGGGGGGVSISSDRDLLVDECEPPSLRVHRKNIHRSTYHGTVVELLE